MAKTLWISHRGFHQRHVENTRLAFDAAIAAGFTCLETDLRTTLDGHIVLHHDATMRGTAGRELVIEEIKHQEFLKVVLNDGQIGMDFTQLVEQYRGLNWIFDIKPDSGAKTLQLLKDWAILSDSEEWLLNQVRFLLWQKDHARLLRKYFPTATTLASEFECRRAGFAVLYGMPWLSGIQRNRCYAVPARIWGQELFAHSFFSAYHKRGARVMAYLPESEEDARKALKAGVDEIITNGKPLDI